MKIICVGRNYSDHIKELKNEVAEEPVIFFKPDTALLKNNSPFYLPDFSNNVQHEIEIVLKISREGKNIQEKFAHKYYNEIGLGIDFTARDLQEKAKEKGLPWALAKGFNGSAPVSEFIPKEKIRNVENINFSLKLNNEIKQSGNTSQMIFSFDYIISFISRYITLKNGDLIFTGTPSGVSAVKAGDKLEGFIENEKLLDFEIR